MSRTSAHAASVSSFLVGLPRRSRQGSGGGAEVGGACIGPTLSCCSMVRIWLMRSILWCIIAALEAGGRPHRAGRALRPPLEQQGTGGARPPSGSGGGGWADIMLCIPNKSVCPH